MSETPAPATTRGMFLAAEAAASSRLDGETIVIGGPITVGERITLAAAGGDTAPGTTAAAPPVAPIMRELLAERARQDAKWGEQNHPDGTGDYPETIDADVAKMACQDAADGGYLTWVHILREEVAEAFAETGPVKLRAELLQVAAVAVAWIEAIDRRSAVANGYREVNAS